MRRLSASAASTAIGAASTSASRITSSAGSIRAVALDEVRQDDARVPEVVREEQAVVLLGRIGEQELDLAVARTPVDDARPGEAVLITDVVWEEQRERVREDVFDRFSSSLVFLAGPYRWRWTCVVYVRGLVALLSRPGGGEEALEKHRRWLEVVAVT